MSGDQPNPNLQKALENLETFSQHIEKQQVANLSHFELKEGKLVAVPHASLKKTISLAYDNLILPGLDERSEVLCEILHSSDVIKSYLPLIMQEDGSPEQKKFAAYAKKAIERFNLAVDKATALPPTWQKRIVHFLYQKSGLLFSNRLVGIELPQKASLHIDFPAQTMKASSKLIKVNPEATIDTASQRISTLREQMIPSFQLEQQILELYYMKVIALLEGHQLLSHVEARTVVVNKPIQFSVDKQEQLLIISQTLVPLPGQQIEVAVAFKKDPRTLTYSIFSSDSITLKSIQTGFPTPNQHHGWALAEVLIPKCLHRPNLLQLFPQCYMNKLKLAQDLLPNGPSSEKARIFLRLKRKAFNANQSRFIELHKKLAIAIAEAAPKAYIPNTFMESAHHFFEALNRLKNPYDVLSSTYEKLMNSVVVLPYLSLEKAWLNGDIRNYDNAQQVLATEMFTQAMKEIRCTQETNDSIEQLAHDFLIAMQQILAPAIQQLILQQYSEIVEYAPPQLDLFSKKLQTAVYQQQEEFYRELSQDPYQCDISQQLSRLLDNDLVLFKSNNLNALTWKSVSIIQELELYYVERASHNP